MFHARNTSYTVPQLFAVRAVAVHHTVKLFVNYYCFLHKQVHVHETASAKYSAPLVCYLVIQNLKNPLL